MRPEDRIAELERRLAEMERQPIARDWTVSALLIHWKSTHGAMRAESTRETDSARVARLVSFFGEADAGALTPDDVARFVAHELESVSGWTVAGCLSTLRRALNLQELHVPRGLSHTIKQCERLATSEVPSRDAWTRDEAAALLELARDHERTLYPALRFALATGARRGEILALRWEDIDFGRGRVNVRRSRNRKSASTKLPKNGRGRFSPIPADLLGFLREHSAAQARAWPFDPPAWVFPSPTGQLWDHNNLSRSWRRLQARMTRAGVRPLPWHCTRHTYITWALESGVPVKRVSEWVGATIQVIEGTYTHVMPMTDVDTSFAETESASEGIKSPFR